MKREACKRMNTSVVLIYCPFPTREAAQQACRQLLNEHLIACGNLLAASQAYYWWEGALTMSEECVLIAKTRPELAESASQRLGSLHPYACPAILRIDAAANPTYAAWVANVTGDAILPTASD